MEVVFTQHANDKLAEREAREFGISADKIIEILKNSVTKFFHQGVILAVGISVLLNGCFPYLNQPDVSSQ